MNTKLLQELLQEYREHLLEQTDATLIEGEDYDELLGRKCDSERDGWDLALTMCDALLDTVSYTHFDSNPAEQMRINRWLGFIQGVLWSTQSYTINEMREQSRPIFK